MSPATTNQYGVDVGAVLAQVELIGPASAADVTGAIEGPPLLTRTLDGASTLKVAVRDQARRLLRSGHFDARSFAVVAGLHLELVSVVKSGDTLDLTFEDAVVTALRRRTDPRTWVAGSLTRQALAVELAKEAGVAIATDPATRPPVAEEIERSADGEVTDSWSILGPLASGGGFRRFSDGTTLLFGGDEWLMTRLPAISVREHTGGVHGIDFELDIGQPASVASLDVDVDLWSVPPGLPVDVVDQGPASGRWLVESYERALTRTRGRVDLTRARASLLEPPPADAGGSERGERGEVDFLPDAGFLDAIGVGGGGAPPSVPAPRSARVAEREAEQAGGRFGGGGTFGATGSAAVEAMLRWARDRQGTRYLWAAKGPRMWDCSGFVEDATAAGGKQLAGGSSQQWAKLRAAGRTLSVEQGIRTRGAILYRAPQGTSPGHIALATGDGYTLEARGSAYPNGRHPATGRNWTGAARWL